MVSREVIEILRRYSVALAEAGITPHRLILYGSHAAGRPGPDSDIDVGVVSPALTEKRFDEGARLSHIAGSISLDLEPIPLTPRAWEEDLWVPLVWEIRTKGIALDDLLAAA